MRVTFHGAARSVTGSMHLLELNGAAVLLDCGLMQGHRKEAFERNRNLPFDPRDIDVLILSHAHIDHSGNIPSLVRHGFRGRIVTTSATRDLCAVMLHDSARIQVREVDRINRRRRQQGKRLFEPLYAPEDVLECMRHFTTAEYDKPFYVCDGVTGTFHDAGHILGSASVILESDKSGRKLGFTGDLGRTAMPILRDPDVIPAVDYLISESTYGDREQPPFQDMPSLLCDVVTRTIDRGGKIIIPAFSVGRTQNLVHSFHQLFNAGHCPVVPIFVDSPLSVNATEVFKMHPECYDEETRAMLEEDGDVFGFGRVTYVRRLEDSKALNRRKESCVIISASGMCEFGRVVHHIRNSIEDSRNTILIVGYQAQHTLGRRLVEGRKKVKIFGEPYDVKAEVQVLNGYSAHADKSDLIGYISACAKHARGIFLVHGDEDQAFALKGHLADQGLKAVHVPERGHSFDLN